MKMIILIVKDSDSDEITQALTSDELSPEQANEFLKFLTAEEDMEAREALRKISYFSSLISSAGIL